MKLKWPRHTTPDNFGPCLFRELDSICKSKPPTTLLWRHIGHDYVSNQPHDCSLNRLFWRRSRKTSKLRVTGLCAGNSPWTGEFPAHRASNAENVSIWWRHHDFLYVEVGAGLIELGVLQSVYTTWLRNLRIITFLCYPHNERNIHLMYGKISPTPTGLYPVNIWWVKPNKGATSLTVLSY